MHGVSAGQNCESAPDDELEELLEELELLLEEELLELLEDELLELLEDEVLEDELLDEELLVDGEVPPPQADKSKARVRARLPPRNKLMVSIVLVPAVIRCDGMHENIAADNSGGERGVLQSVNRFEKYLRVFVPNISAIF